jgi:hypothetical protein
MKKIEEVIIKKSEKFGEFIYNNTKYKSFEVDELGLPFDRTYIGNKVLPNQIIEMISDLMFYRNFYLGRIENRTKSDSILISEIKNEINLE